MVYEYRRVQPFKPNPAIFGQRLRMARLAANLPQDRLGVQAGLDEGTASARISRYESGVHEPNHAFAQRLAFELGVPTAYFYAEEDDLAKLILWFSRLDGPRREQLLQAAADMGSERG